MSEADAAIIKQEGSPYVTVFVSDSDVITDETDDAQVVDTQQIIVQADESVAVEEYNDIHCVISQENGKFEASENEDLSNDSNRTLWTRNNVRLLINEYKALQHEFQDPWRKQKDLWATLASRLSEKVAKEEGEGNSWMASQVTWDACDRKWRNLKHTFKTIHTNQWRSFRSRSRWEFYAPLLEIFGNSIECRRPTKAEKTRYVVVHPQSQEGGRSIMVPVKRKSSGGPRQAEISDQLPTVIAADDGGSGEETVFVEEVKVDESGAPGYMFMKSSKIGSLEPLKKQMKLSHVVHGQVKIRNTEDGETLSMDKDSDFSSKCASSKTKDEDSTSECRVVRETSSDAQEAVDKSSSPPLWFINFLKEYQEEEKKQRETLKRAHEDLLRVEERKVKALENILSKLSSGQFSNSSNSSDTRCESETRL